MGRRVAPRDKDNATWLARARSGLDQKPRMELVQVVEKNSSFVAKEVASAKEVGEVTESAHSSQIEKSTVIIHLVGVQQV